MRDNKRLLLLGLPLCGEIVSVERAPVTPRRYYGKVLPTPSTGRSTSKLPVNPREPRRFTYSNRPRRRARAGIRQLLHNTMH